MAKRANDSQRVVFARVGWMRAYAGSVPGDERPVGGGSYNKREIGSEVLNFKKRGTRLFGYFETHTQASQTRLERIDRDAVDLDELDNVLVVYVARNPLAGQVVVGWYDKAKLLREPRTRPDSDHSYRCTARLEDCVLVPVPKRHYEIPAGAGAMGQSNVCYPLEANGSLKQATWMAEAVEYVRSYDAENALTDKIADAADEIATDAENALSRAQGRRVIDPETRKALEEYGVKKAMAHFRREGFDVKNVGSTHSYDVCCRKNGRELCVEVKTTTSTGEQVMLTANEAALKGDRALFIVHSVELKGRKPVGGKVKMIRPWKLESKRLKVVSYLYTVPT